jgi:catechol 2,3-dioxygenase-like lactoylglutathione lyase family enzyme
MTTIDPDATTGGAMTNLHARTVFFVEDGERALEFYRDELGCSLDWNFEEDGRPFVFQVNLLGFELILNQKEGWTEGRAGKGRVFIGLDDDQVDVVRRHFKEHDVAGEVFFWGEPTIVVRDPDGNELFFWLSVEERKSLEAGQLWP